MSVADLARRVWAAWRYWREIRRLAPLYRFPTVDSSGEYVRRAPLADRPGRTAWIVACGLGVSPLRLLQQNGPHLSSPGSRPGFVVSYYEIRSRFAGGRWLCEVVEGPT